jgi:hypothetical protein
MSGVRTMRTKLEIEVLKQKRALSTASYRHPHPDVRPRLEKTSARSRDAFQLT